MAETAREPLVDVRELARVLAVEPAWIYEHAAELGAFRLGSGPRARLRFDVAEVLQRLGSCSAVRESQSGSSGSVEPQPRARRRRPLGSGVELLPIRGVGGAE